MSSHGDNIHYLFSDQRPQSGNDSSQIIRVSPHGASNDNCFYYSDFEGGRRTLIVFTSLCRKSKKNRPERYFLEFKKRFEGRYQNSVARDCLSSIGNSRSILSSEGAAMIIEILVSAQCLEQGAQQEIDRFYQSLESRFHSATVFRREEQSPRRRALTVLIDRSIDPAISRFKKLPIRIEEL